MNEEQLWLLLRELLAMRRSALRAKEICEQQLLEQIYKANTGQAPDYEAYEIQTN